MADDGNRKKGRSSVTNTEGGGRRRSSSYENAPSSASLAKSKSHLGRSASLLESDSSDSSDDNNLRSSRFSGTGLSGEKKKKKKEAKDTLVNAFLLGDEKKNAAELVMRGIVNFIPDPAGAHDAKGQRKHRKKQLKMLQQLILRHQKEQTQLALEVQVQEYWKRFAGWPDTSWWPEMQEVRDSHARFAEEFRSFSLTHDKDVTKPDATVARSFKTFVVVSEHKVAVRTCPTHDDAPELLTGTILRPGQVVIVETVVIRGDERYLKLSQGNGGGWVFEFKDDIEVMVELVHCETGMWWYRVTCSEFLEIRRVPSYCRGFGTGWVMCPGEVCVACLRAHIEGRHTFVMLADGRGWVFLLKSDEAIAQNMQGSPVVLEQCDKLGLDDSLAEIDLDGDGRISADEIARALEGGMGSGPGSDAIETGLWEYQVMDDPVLCIGNNIYGTLLHPGEKITVDLRAPASGKKTKEVSAKKNRRQSDTQVLDRVWLRLYDQRGWIPKADTYGRQIVRFLGAGTAREKKTPDVVLPKDNWKYGSC